ncbi:MAG TPA: VOC family protein [Methylomirabilota bacterium]|jgi:catechol 2,3-dioxygenase-like lactoylglutathione lyase family enzyme
MPKIKHIALSTQDPEKTARFYVDGFGMKQIDRVDHPTVSGFFLTEIALRLAAAGSARRDDVNAALGVGRGEKRHANVEVKYGGPDGVMLDVSETGWVGASGFRPQ